MRISSIKSDHPTSDMPSLLGLVHLYVVIDLHDTSCKQRFQTERNDHKAKHVEVETINTQESIPVGCVPSTALAVGGEGVSAPVHVGICLPGGGGGFVCSSACWDTHTPCE